MLNEWLINLLYDLQLATIIFLSLSPPSGNGNDNNSYFPGLFHGKTICVSASCELTLNQYINARKDELEMCLGCWVQGQITVWGSNLLACFVGPLAKNGFGFLKGL